MVVLQLWGGLSKERRKEGHSASLHCVCVAVCACTFSSAALFGELFLRGVVSGGAHMSSLRSVVSAVLKRRERSER